MKNGFYQRILQPSEHLKRVGAKNFYFFKTLLDGPFYDFGDPEQVKAGYLTLRVAFRSIQSLNPC